MGRNSRSNALAERVTPRAKLWLEVNSQYVFGLGISEILKAIQHTGSIKAAAREVGKSYRHVWEKVFPVGGEVEVQVLAVEEGGRRIRLSRKAILDAAERAEIREYSQRKDVAPSDGSARSRTSSGAR